MSQFYPNTARNPSVPEYQRINPTSRRNRRLLRELKRSAGYDLAGMDFAEIELRAMAYLAGQQS